MSDNSHQKTTQAVVSDTDELKPNQKTEKFALFLEDGSSLTNVITDLLARVDDLENP